MARFIPQHVQQVVTAELPRVALELEGRELHRLLSKVQVRWPAEVVIRKLEIRRKHD